MPASRALLITLGAALLLVGAVGCPNNDDNVLPGLYPWQLPINTGRGPTQNDPQLESIRLEPGGGINLQVGTGLDFRAVGHFSNGQDVDITDVGAVFNQTNPTVGTLSPTGDFTAFVPGQTTIYAQVDNVFSDAAFVFASNLITPGVSAVQNLDGTILPGDQFRLTWDASPFEESVIGYLVYRSRTSAVFTFKTQDGDPDSANQITVDPVVPATFTDTTAAGGVVYYVVQAVRRDLNDPLKLIYGAPSRQLKVNFATGEIGEGN